MKQQGARINKKKYLMVSRRKNKTCKECKRALIKSNKSGLCNNHYNLKEMEEIKKKNQGGKDE